MATMLVVTWEKGLAQAIVQALGAQGHLTVVAQNGPEALRAIWNVRFSLVILDAFLLEDGMDVLGWIRSDPVQKSMPVLFLAPQGWAPQPWQDHVKADDILTKPLDLTNLLEKTEALLAWEASSKEDREPQKLQAGPVILDCRNFSVYAGSEEVPLTPTEFKLLRYFIEHVGEVIPVPSLTSYLWGTEAHLGGPELVRVHIRNLRTKIQRSAGYPFQAISTVPRKGYIMLREVQRLLL